MEQLYSIDQCILLINRRSVSTSTYRNGADLCCALGIDDCVSVKWRVIQPIKLTQIVVVARVNNRLLPFLRELEKKKRKVIEMS